MKKAIKYIFPILLLLISVSFFFLGVTSFGFWNSAKGPLGGFYPTLISVVLLVMSLVLLKLAGKQKDPDFRKEEWLIVEAVVMVFLCSYVVGMIPSLLLFQILWLRLVEKHSWKFAVIFAICVVTVIYLIFGVWLGIMFPVGLIGNLLF